MVQETTIEKLTLMLTDRNIDKKTARYWCLFCNTAPRTLNEAVMTRLVNPSDDLARAYKEYDSMTDAQKAATAAVEKLRASNGARIGNELKYVVDGMSKDDAAKVATKIIADLDANGKDVPAAMARELGQTFMTPEKVMPDGSQLLQVAPDSNLVGTIAGTEKFSSGKAKGWLGRVWDVVKGRWKSLVDAVSEWFIGGKWEGASVEDKFKMLGTGGLHTLELVAIAYIVYKIRGWLFPQLKLAWKNLMSHNELARCKFSDTDGNGYLCWFDKRKMRWQVKHDRGIKALFHKDDLFMTHDEEDAFFATKFFSRFAKQCEKYILPYLDVTRSKQQLENKDTPSDVKRMLSFIVDNAEKLKTNMFGMSYSYFNEGEDSID